MANMKDIADRAGVSIATVSKVLNGIGGISTETSELVLSIAKELHYRPNLYARSLKKGQSKTIGIITEDLTVFNTPPIIDGIGGCCEEHGYHYLLENLRLDKLHINPTVNVEHCNKLINDAINLLLSMQVDGIIYVGCHSHKVTAHPLSDSIPMVCAYCSSPNLTIPSVLYDDLQAAYDLTNLLLREGHRKIGMVTGPIDSDHAKRRLTGFQEALYDNGTPYNPHLTAHGDWTRDSGYHAMPSLLRQGITAIFAHNDVMAMGIIDYCIKHDVAIGTDLALIGFDNREVSTVCRPTLSTIELPLYQIGYTSTSILIDKMKGTPNTIERKTSLSCKIIERDSTRLYMKNKEKIQYESND